MCRWSLDLIFKAKLKLECVRKQKIQYGHQTVILKVTLSKPSNSHSVKKNHFLAQITIFWKFRLKLFFNLVFFLTGKYNSRYIYLFIYILQKVLIVKGFFFCTGIAVTTHKWPWVVKEIWLYLPTICSINMGDQFGIGFLYFTYYISKGW